MKAERYIILCTEILNGMVSIDFQGVTESPKKGDKTDRSKSSMKAAKPETKKSGGAAETAASPKTENKLKKRGEIELEAKSISM